MIKTIRDFDLKEKRVIIRCDFNVPVKDNLITDDNRIISSLKTINYAIANDAKVILMSHLGRIKEEADKEKNSLKIVTKRLSELLNKDVKFISQTRGNELEIAVNNMKNGDVILMENTRFEDYPNKLESGNDFALSKYWASLGDIFINDAFGTIHRSHASNVGIASLLPSGIGFLIEKELIFLHNIENSKRPFTVIIGGAKVSDKIGVIENFAKKADHILVGGCVANTFLKAKGLEVGKSLIDTESLDFCKRMLANYYNKIILPVDLKGSNEIKESAEVIETKVEDIPNDFISLDIGNETIKNFEKYLETSETIVWSGPMGKFEFENFANGTKKMAENLAKIEGITIIGGGDTIAAILNMGYCDSYTHLSTGGSATLKLLEGAILPSIEILKKGD